MASFTFDIPDADVPRITAALYDRYPGATTPKQALVALIKEAVRMYERRQAQNDLAAQILALQQAADEAQPDIGIT